MLVFYRNTRAYELVSSGFYSTSILVDAQIRGSKRANVLANSPLSVRQVM